MAYWQRRPDGRVYVYRSEGGKLRAMPRAEVKHLDAQPDEVTERFVASLNQPKPALQTTPEIDRLLDRYCEYLKVRKERNPATIDWVRSAMHRYVLPYFLSHDPPMKDPLSWPGRSAFMLDWLEKNEVSKNIQSKCNSALTGFWDWMRKRHLVPAGLALVVERPTEMRAATPLQYTLTPNAVLEFAARAEPEMAFLALAGYFFSLRPQETLALTKSDFRAGSVAAALESGRVMRGAGLFDRLAVHIGKQSSKGAKAITGPKGKFRAVIPMREASRAWVSCFNAEAARRMLDLIRVLDETAQGGLLVRFSVDYNLHRWAKNGIPNITLKDLRRASLYWLGHYSSLNSVSLKNHARHSLLTTTELYLRRPDETVAPQFDLDLDA